jgi:hypothetical protein
VDAGGTAIDFPGARQKFEAAWTNLRTAFTYDDFAKYRFARGWDGMEANDVGNRPQAADANLGMPP